jgi:hypothetical protein
MAIVGTSVPPKLALCGAGELLTKVTWSPDFASRGCHWPDAGSRSVRVVGDVAVSW